MRYLVANKGDDILNKNNISGEDNILSRIICTIIDKIFNQ